MNRNTILESIRPLVFLVTLMFSLSSFAWEYPTAAPAVPFAGGDGSESAPYQIADAQQLANLSYLVNNKVGAYNQAYYIVTSDIDLESKQWTPISTTKFDKDINNSQKGTGFKGIFNGQGHFIRNIKIDNSGLSGTNNPVAGLFGLLSEGAEIRNVRISGSIVSNEPAGGIAGLVCSSSKNTAPVVIEGCLSSVDITEGGSTNAEFSGNAGGILGVAYQGTVHVLSCGYSGKMTRAGADSRMNAIVGLVGTGATDSRVFAMINNCYNTTKDIPGSTNNTDSWKWGNMTYYRSGTAVVFMGSNNYSACVNDAYAFESTKMQMCEEEKIKSHELAWLLNSNQMSVVGSAYARGNKQYWTCDDETGAPVPVCYNPEAYKPICRVTVISTLDKDNVTYLFTNSSGKISVEHLSSTAKYFLDAEQKNEISLADHDITEDCSIYAQEKIVATLQEEGTKLTVHFVYEGKDQASSTVVINGREYTFSCKWYLNGKELGETSTSIQKKGEGTYKVQVTSSPAGYSWQLIKTYGTHRVYCKPSSKSSMEDGSETNPYKSLANAYASLVTTEEGGTIDNQRIIVMEDIDLDKEGFMTVGPIQGFTKDGCDDKPVTITAKDSEKAFEVDGRYAALVIDAQGGDSRPFFQTGDIKLDSISLKAGTYNQHYWACQGWNLTIAKGVSVIGMNMLNGSGDSGVGLFGLSQNSDYVSPPDFHIIAGYVDLEASPTDGTLRYPHDVCKILIQSGRYARIIGGSRTTVAGATRDKYNRTLGDPLHPFKVDIVVDIEDSQESGKLDINQITGGQTDANCYMDSHITIKHGKVGRIIGGNISFGRKGKDENSPRNTFYGKVQIDIEGGTVHALYGQNLGRTDQEAIKPWAWFYGKTIINVSGDSTVVGVPPEIGKGSVNVTGIYGGSSNGQGGYDAHSTDVNKNLGKAFMDQMNWDATEVVFNIDGGTFYQPIYGAGYGYSEYITPARCDTDAGCLNGNVYLNINGGTFLDNVFGAARGTDSYAKYTGADLTKLAQVKGNVVVNIYGGKFKKNIYGGSLGFANYKEMAKVTGNTYVNVKGVDTEVDGNVYGGGNNAKVVGNANVYIGGGNN